MPHFASYPYNEIAILAMRRSIRCGTYPIGLLIKYGLLAHQFSSNSHNMGKHETDNDSLLGHVSTRGLNHKFLLLVNNATPLSLQWTFFHHINSNVPPLSFLFYRPPSSLNPIVRTMWCSFPLLTGYLFHRGVFSFHFFFERWQSRCKIVNASRWLWPTTLRQARFPSKKGALQWLGFQGGGRISSIQSMKEGAALGRAHLPLR